MKKERKFAATSPVESKHSRTDSDSANNYEGQIEGKPYELAVSVLPIGADSFRQVEEFETGFDNVDPEVDHLAMVSLLAHVGLSEYAMVFKKEAIGLSILLKIDVLNESLRDIGITKLGHRVQLIDAVRRIKAAQV
jgi:hypothetical protein